MASTAPLDPAKFRDPIVTARGERRAWVSPAALETLWFNTGTLCNITCRNCYIESSPRNDRLAYLTAAEVGAYLDEIERTRLGTTEIGFTGGEPFMNPEMPAMLADALGRGYRVLVLTNAMRPMMRHADALIALRRWDDAGDALDRYVKINSSSVEAHAKRRRVCKARNDAEGARRAEADLRHVWRTLPAYQRRRQLGWYVRSLL